MKAKILLAAALGILFLNLQADITTAPISEDHSAKSDSIDGKKSFFEPDSNTVAL